VRGDAPRPFLLMLEEGARNAQSRAATHAFSRSPLCRSFRPFIRRIGNACFGSIPAV
jgi:hypothetical protein